MKNSKNNNIILGFGYWVLEFGFSWCKGKIIWTQIVTETIWFTKCVNSIANLLLGFSLIEKIMCRYQRK